MNQAVSQQDLDALFTTLSHEKRRAMVHMLSLRPATIKQLADETNLSFPAIHKHIAILENAGLIIRKKVGRTNFVVLGKAAMNIVKDWSTQYRTDWGNDQETLDNYIASMGEP